MGVSGAMGSSSNGSTNATAPLACPNCNLNFAGYPAGLRFAPSDQEIIGHLESMVKEGGGSSSRAHALINHFITTIEGDIGICYTHPENLPGVTRDSLSKHFFHRPSRAYLTGTRKRRKIVSSEHGQQSSEDAGEAHWHWHKTGKTSPVTVGGVHKGWKKIMVLQNIKHGKREKTNWVMYQYHLGTSEEEKDGELAVSKVFYRCPPETMTEDQNDEKVEVISEAATPNILPVSGAAPITASTGTMVQPQQNQLQRQAHGDGQGKFAPAKMFQEAGVGDPVSGDQGQVVHGNNHHIPSKHPVQSVMEPDTALSVQAGVADPVSGDQGQVHGNNHHVPSQHPVQSVHMEPDTTLSVQVGVGDLVSGDQGQVHGNNHHIPSQHHVQSVETEPDTTLSLAVSTGHNNGGGVRQLQLGRST